MTHPGIVTAVKPGSVSVQIQSTSACASCEAHAHCGFAESKNKTLDIPVKYQTGNIKFEIGDNVTVHIDHERGLLAVLFAYILPAILLLAAVIGFSLASFSELNVILLSLALLALYILFLFLFRHKLEKRFTLSVHKNDNTITH